MSHLSPSKSAGLLKVVALLCLGVAIGASAQSAPQGVDAQALERFQRGVALAGQRPAAAIEIFEALTREYPEWPEPYNNLAVLYAGQGEEKKAEQALLAAMGTHPTYALVHKNLEALYTAMAGRAYRKALENSSAGPAPKLALVERAGTISAAAPPPAIALVAQDAAAEPEPAREAEAVAAVTPRSGSTAEPAPAPARPDTADEARRAVLATVASWLEAWSSQDVGRYLSFYGHHFDPGDGTSRDRWAESRRRRVAGPEFIEIEIQNPSVTFDGDDRAAVRFLQSYRSNTFEGRTIKTLRLSRGSEGWKIVREDTGG